MVYHSHGVKLSKAQAKKLQSGETIKLSHDALNGSEEVHLTKTQLHRMMKAYEQGKGTTLRFSQAQVKHHAHKVGGSLWGTLKDYGQKAYDIGSAVYSNPIGKKIIDFGANKALSKVGIGNGMHKWRCSTGLEVKQAMRKHKKHGSGLLGSAIKGLSDGVIGHLGIGLRPRKQAHVNKKGSGFLGSIASTLVHGGVDALGLGLQPKRKTKKHHSGGSFKL